MYRIFGRIFREKLGPIKQHKPQISENFLKCNEYNLTRARGAHVSICKMQKLLRSRCRIREGLYPKLGGLLCEKGYVNFPEGKINLS